MTNQANPQITIIMPVWNGMRYLDEAIQSLLNQNFQNWELLISDDGSTDGSKEYLSSLNDSRISVYYQRKNLGIFGNLNYLFKIAKSQLTYILCQDDYLINKESLNAIVSYWNDKSSNLGMVRFNQSIDAKCSLTRLQRDITPKIVTKDESSLWFFIFGNIPGNLSNVSLRTSIVEELGGFNQDFPFAGDFEFWVRLAEKYDIGVEQTPVSYIRRHSNAASVFLNLNGELILQNAKIVNRLYEALVSRRKKNIGFVRLLGNINYDSSQRYLALKRILYKNDFSYLKLLENANLYRVSFVYGNKFLLWIIFFFSLGGRILRASIARRILKMDNVSN